MPRENPDYDVFGPEYIKEVEDMEKLTREKVSSTISSIEVAITAYESAKKKPLDLKPRIERLKKIKISLEKWERESLANAHVKDVNARIIRLRAFTEICDTFA